MAAAKAWKIKIKKPIVIIVLFAGIAIKFFAIPIFVIVKGDEIMSDTKFLKELWEFSENPESEKHIEEFLCGFTGRSSAVCCAGAGTALDIALYTMGIGKKDAVFVSAIAPLFVVSSVLKSGAHIFFCDITNENPGINPAFLEKKINEVIFDGEYEPRCVILSDSFGYMPRVAEIEKICNRYGLVLVEDASEGFGGSFDGRMAGSFGDISVVGFNKALWHNMGEAGAILTDNDTLLWRFSTSANGGVPLDSADGTLKYKGTYSKIHPIDAFVIENELEDFDQRIKERSKRYSTALEGLKNDAIPFKSSTKYFPSWTSCPVIVKNSEKRERVIGMLTEKGFSAKEIFPDIPVCLHPISARYYSKFTNECSAAKKIFENLLMIL